MIGRIGTVRMAEATSREPPIRIQGMVIVCKPERQRLGAQVEEYGVVGHVASRGGGSRIHLHQPT